MTINFEFYRTFYYVVKYGSISAAAKALYVTQPTVTHAIQTMERELGCTLFIRNPRGVIMTPEARMLYEHIAIACEHIFEAENALTKARQMQKGSIAIGATETTLHHYLLPYLTSYRKEYPDIRLKITNSTTPATFQSLRSELLDIAVLVMPPGHREKDCLITPLAQFSDKLIAGRNYAFLQGRKLSLKELTTYPLISMEKGTITRQIFDEFFLSHHLELEPDIELATSDLITPMVASGLGIGFVPEAFATERLKDGSIIELQLNETIPMRDICLVARKDHIQTIAAQAFIRMLSKGSPAEASWNR